MCQINDLIQVNDKYTAKATFRLVRYLHYQLWTNFSDSSNALNVNMKSFLSTGRTNLIVINENVTLQHQY